MGLDEKRGIENFKKDQYPTFKKKIEEAAGFPVDVEVQWETLEVVGKASKYSERYKKLFFEPVINGLKKVTEDDLGKTGLKEKLKKIVIAGSLMVGVPWKFSFQEGILSVRRDPDTDVDDVLDRTNEIKKLIESKL